MGDTKSVSSDEMLNRARAGDRSALGRLFGKYRSWLVAVARRKAPQALAHKENASDLVQDCFAEAVSNFPEFRGENALTFRQWLKGILLNGCRHVYRHWGRQRRNAGAERSLPVGASADVALAAEQTPVVERLARREEVAWLKCALRELSEDDYRLFHLRFFEDLPFDAIAARLGANPATLRQQATRLIDKLREGIPLLQRMQLRNLLPRQQQAVCRWYFQNWSQEAIADAFQIPPNAVAKWIREAKTSLLLQPGDEA
jgi:RNA polymerase sigma-70 factor (ECF subfamily)